MYSNEELRILLPQGWTFESTYTLPRPMRLARCAKKLCLNLVDNQKKLVAEYATFAEFFTETGECGLLMFKPDAIYRLELIPDPKHEKTVMLRVNNDLPISEQTLDNLRKRYRL